MKATELRIGNWVYDTYRGRAIETPLIELLDFELDEERLKPIPLTEKWLLNFGFERDDIDWWFLPNTSIGFKREGYLMWDFYIHNTQIEYVHQLQNLYFALIGEELKINQ